MAVDVSRSVAGCRSRFTIFERLTYLNSCSQGALSDSVRQAYDAYLTDWDEKGAPWEYWIERAETARHALEANGVLPGQMRVVVQEAPAGVTAVDAERVELQIR